MKLKLVFNLPKKLRRDVNILALFNDALAEFIGERDPAKDYVAKRYPDGYCGDHTRDNEKIMEVVDRLQVAKSIRSTMDFTGENEECDANDDCPSCPLEDMCDDAAAELYRQTVKEA